MIFNLQIICLLSTVVAVSVSTPVKNKEYHSKLMLEYDWPQPKKNLKRFPHPESCVHFYHVKHDGSYVLKRCHGEEVFDYRSLRCKGKNHAKCWKDLIRKITSKKTKKQFSCPFPWGLYPDAEDCKQFHECLGGKSHLRNCPASTLFDKAERTCINENEAICADESDDAQLDGYICPFKWGFSTHPTDCSKYYECLRKVPSIRTCKKNMLFDNFKRKCLPMDIVDCGARLNPYENIPTVSELLTSRKSRTEIVGISTESSRRSSLEEVITENSKTEFEKIASESSRSEPEGITAERPKTKHEEIISEESKTRFDGSTSKVKQTENLLTEAKQEGTATEGLKFEFDMIRTENPRTKFYGNTSEDRRTEPEKVATENLRTHEISRSISEDRRAKVKGTVTEKLGTKSRSGEITTEHSRTEHGDATTKNSRTGVEKSSNVVSEEPLQKI